MCLFKYDNKNQVKQRPSFIFYLCQFLHRFRMSVDIVINVKYYMSSLFWTGPLCVHWEDYKLCPLDGE